MAKIIEGIPDFITREDYLNLFRAAGFTPEQVFELRFSPDGVHAVVAYHDENGHKVIDKQNPNGGWVKHRVFIPVRYSDDETKTTRIKPVKGKAK